MERSVKDKNILNKLAGEFVGVLDKNKVKYIIVSGFVAIAHGRSRGTEDIDIIIERIPLEKFRALQASLEKSGFECLQGEEAEELFKEYLENKTSIRYVWKGIFVPEIELKMARDALDEKQIRERIKLPLTGLPFYFSSIEANIAFKEELLKSDKDLEDARHLRIIYAEKLDEQKIREIKSLVRKHRLGG